MSHGSHRCCRENRSVRSDLLQLHPPRFWIRFWRWVVIRLLMTWAMLFAASRSSYSCSPVRSTRRAPKNPNVETSAKSSPVFRVKKQQKKHHTRSFCLSNRLVPAANREACVAVSSKFMAHASRHIGRGCPRQVVAQAHARAC